MLGCTLSQSLLELEILGMLVQTRENGRCMTLLCLAFIVDNILCQKILPLFLSLGFLVVFRRHSRIKEAFGRTICFRGDRELVLLGEGGAGAARLAIVIDLRLFLDLGKSSFLLAEGLIGHLFGLLFMLRVIFDS